MKKLLCLLLATLLMVTCFAGCKKNPTDDFSSVSSQPQIIVQDEFVKPTTYASVVLVTINPQFRLYLDASGVVLAVEPVNADAKSIETKVSFENKNVQEVVNNLIVAANDGGFVKTNAKIDIKVTEVVDENVIATEILENIKTSANQKLTELDIKAELTTSVVIENANNDTASEDNASSQETTSSSQPQDTTSEPPACKHEKTKFNPIVTGNNIIDDSKLDVVNHSKVCKDCGEQIALEKHTVSNGKCTVCGQSNFAIATKYATSAGVSGDGINVAEINADGSLSYNLVIENSWWSAEGEFIDEWTKKIPEAEMLKAIRERFVMSDAEFAKLNAQGSYNCSLGTQTYSDGYFHCSDPAAGGPGDYLHEIIGYKDNNNGTFSVYYDYIEGGPDVDVSEHKHQYYYAVEYTYSGVSNLKIEKVNEDGYEYLAISGWTPVVNSMRVKSIKKVADISGITIVK